MTHRKFIRAATALLMTLAFTLPVATVVAEADLPVATVVAEADLRGVTLTYEGYREPVTDTEVDSSRPLSASPPGDSHTLSTVVLLLTLVAALWGTAAFGVIRSGSFNRRTTAFTINYNGANTSRRPLRPPVRQTRVWVPQWVG